MTANDLELERWRGRVDERLEQLKEGQDALPGQIEQIAERLERALLRHADDDKAVEAKHELRITTLEHAQTRVAVIATLLSLLFSAVAAAAARKLIG